MSAPILLLLVALSPFWPGLEPGPYGIGYESLPIRDYSRPFRSSGEDRTRLLTLSIWYPAEPSPTDAPMGFDRYVEPSGPGRARDVGPRERPSAERRRAARGHGYRDRGGRRSGRRSAGVYPLLLFGSGITAPTYLHTVLCELLASHGYVVVAVPSLAYRADVSPDYDALTVETHLRDLELVIHELRDYPGADIETLGLVAWGSGGVAQVLLQMKNPDVAAVVSLDAASGYRYGRELLSESLYFEPARTTAAFFHVTDSRESTGRPKSFDYYDNVHRGPELLLLMEGARHAELTSLASVVPPDTSDDVRRRYRFAVRVRAAVSRLRDQGRRRRGRVSRRRPDAARLRGLNPVEAALAPALSYICSSALGP